jgi:hypothetical protein
VLTHHIEKQLHKREGKALTNFQRTLSPPQSDLAEQPALSLQWNYATNLPDTSLEVQMFDGLAALTG